MASTRDLLEKADVFAVSIEKYQGRSQVTGQDIGCVATFSGRPFHDLRCS
jgi:hypothetical protein